MQFRLGFRIRRLTLKTLMLLYISAMTVYLPCSSLLRLCNWPVMCTNNARSTLDDFQLDAQNSCLFTYNTLIKILCMFRALPCSSSGGLRRNCIYAASGIATFCRWLSVLVVWSCRFDYTRRPHCLMQFCFDLFVSVCLSCLFSIANLDDIHLRRRSPEDEQGNARNM